MTDKTRAKIKAMAKKHDRTGPDSPIHLEKLAPFIHGATPWAEWCERFEGLLDFAQDPDNFQVNILPQIDDLLKEYRQFLEIEPIKQETAEDVLRDWIKREEQSIKQHGPYTPASYVPEFMDRAKAVLGERRNTIDDDAR